MRIEPARPLEPLPLAQREFLVEVYGPLFGAIGRLALPSPVRLSDFVNEREGFLRLTDVEFATDGDMTATPEKGPLTESEWEVPDEVLALFPDDVRAYFRPRRATEPSAEAAAQASLRGGNHSSANS